MNEIIKKRRLSEADKIFYKLDYKKEKNENFIRYILEQKYYTKVIAFEEKTGNVFISTKNKITKKKEYCFLNIKEVQAIKQKQDEIKCKIEEEKKINKKQNFLYFSYDIKHKKLINDITKEVFSITRLESRFILYLMFNQTSSIEELTEYLYHNDFYFMNIYKNAFKNEKILKKDQKLLLLTRTVKTRLTKKTNLQIRTRYGFGYEFISNIKIIKKTY